MTLVSAESSASLRTPWFAFGATYRRPVRVDVAGRGGTLLSVRDLVMLTRIALIVLSIVTASRRLLR